MPSTLDQILATTRATLPELQGRRAELERRAAAAPPAPPFGPALRGERVGLIAELKRRSPSAGAIRSELDPPDQAARYAAGGAAAVSVLTDSPYFGGSIEDLEAVAGAVSLPLLRKDFILDELQLAESRAAGASAVLLIVRALAPRRLAELLREARAFGLDALVEVHDRAELDIALDSGAGILGVNSRNLADFTLDRDAAWRLLDAVPADRIAVAESGMRTAEDVAAAAAAGADAVLVGTALSSAADPIELVRAMAATARRGRA